MQVERVPRKGESGVRDSNTWITYLLVSNSCGKLQVMRDEVSGPKVRFRREMGPRPIS